MILFLPLFSLFPLSSPSLTHSELPVPEAGNVQSGGIPLLAESQPLYPPPAKAGNKTYNLSQFLRCGSFPLTLICPQIISGPGRPTCRSPGASRTPIQLSTSNTAISKGDLSTKSLARVLHWDSQLHERLHQGKPAPGICRETPGRGLPEFSESSQSLQCSPQVSHMPLTPRSQFPARPSTHCWHKESEQEHSQHKGH